MRFTYATPTKQARDNLIQFGGLNKTLTVKDGEFSDMLNMTGDHFPVLSPRERRLKCHTFTDFNGIYGKTHLLWVDGTALYYNRAPVEGVSLADSAKTFVGMGAYVLIFPDKKVFNTVTMAVTEIENTVTTAGTVTFAEDSGLITISCTGIGVGFRALDAVDISGATDTAMNGSFVISEVMDDSIVVAGSISAGFSQASALTVSRTCPDMDFVTECNNRVWGCSSTAHEVYACKLGDPYNWRAYEALSTDSYAATIGSDGDFTGAATHQGNVYFFKEKTIIQIMGQIPSQFKIDEMPARGVQKGSEKSIALVNERLLYKAVGGVVAFDGAYPTDISKALGEAPYRAARGGCVDSKYYVCMEDANDAWHLFVFDTDTGLWHREDDAEASVFVTCQSDTFFVEGQVLWAVTRGDKAEEFTEEEEGYVAAVGETPAYITPLPWYAETGDMLWLTLDNKIVSRLQVRIDLIAGSALTVSISYDGGSWEDVFTAPAETGRKAHDIRIIPRRCDRFKMKIAGAGYAKVYAISKTVESGGGL